MKKNVTINDLRADSGFFPVDNDGIWHSGIHIGVNKNEEITSPVNGKIIVANIETKNEEKDNFFWICEELHIPIKNGNRKSINSYSLLSNIESYKKYTSYTDYTPIKDYDLNLFSKNGDLPLGIRAVINTNLYEIPYIQLFDDANDFNFLNSTYFENFGTGKDLKVGRYKPKTEEKEININFSRTDVSTDAFITKNLLKDGITCPEWTVGHIDNGYFIPDNNSRLQYDELKTKEGYIAVDGKELTISSKGYIDFKSPEYFIENTNSNLLAGNKLIIIRKNEKNKIQKIFETIEKEIQENNDELQDLSSRIKRLNQQLDELNKQKNIFGKYNKKDSHLAEHEKELKKELNDSIKDYKEAQENYVSLSSQQYIFSSIYSKFEIEKKDAILLILNEKKLDVAFKQLFLPGKYILYKKDVNNLELFISNETIIRDEFLKIQYKDLLTILKNNKVTYIECSYTDFSELYKEKILSEMVTGLEVIYQGKEKSRVTGVFKCRPYLFKDKIPYHFPFKHEKINVYRKQKIIDYANAETKTKKGVLVFSNSDVKYVNDRKYDKEPISIISGEYEITNLYELLKNNNKYGKISIKSDEYYKCKLSAGYAFIKGKDLKIKLIIDKPENLKNKQIGQNTFLGHIRQNRPYLDWATFFSDNLLEIEPEKITLEIPGGIKCKKIEKPKKQIFLSNNTYLKTTDVKDNQDFAKLEEVKVVITIYVDDNKDFVEVNKGGTLTIKDSINELYFYCHSFTFKKDSESGEVKLSGGAKVSQYVQNDITTESEEVKIYAEKIILPKILNKTIKWDSNGTTGTHLDPNSYKFTVTITPEEIATAYNFSYPLYIDKKTITLSLDNQRNYGKGQVFTVYNDEKNEIDTTLPSTSDNKPVYSNDNYVESKDDLYVDVEGIKYKIENKQLNQYKKDNLKEYWEKLIPLNYKYENYVQVTDEKICPSDSLLCKVKELKEKLKETENGIFSEYLDYDKNGIGSNRIYKEDAYKLALNAGINRFIAYHPLEFDKELHSNLMEEILPHIYVEEFSDETDNDIAAVLPINEEDKDQNNQIKIQENKFYFVYPPLFDDVIEKAKIREFNPYENNSLADLKNLSEAVIDKRTGKNYDLSKNKLDNPGFAPYTGIGSNYSNNQGYAKVNGYFMEDYGSYGHEGVDFTGNGWIARSRPKEEHTPIHSLINGVVVKMADHGKYNYGLHMIISDGNNKLYLLGHLCGYENGITIGSIVTPKSVVGYVGNTGNCAGYDESVKEDGRGSHLHLSIFKFDDSFAKDIISYVNNKNIVEDKVNSRIRIKDTRYTNVYTYSCYDNTKQKYKVIDPFNHFESRK